MESKVYRNPGNVRSNVRALVVSVIVDMCKRATVVESIE